MTAPAPTLPQLLANAHKHLEDVRQRAPGFANLRVAIDTVEGDLNAIGKLLNNMHCDLRTQLDLM